MSLFAQGRALIIGVADYRVARSLPAAVRNDAVALQQMLVSPRCGYASERVASLLDAQATKAAIIGALDRLAGEATGEDTVLVYFSGHGGRLPGDPDAYVIPHDTATNDVAGTAISATMLTDKLARINAKKLLVFLDCCHAAGTAALKGEADGQWPFTIGFDHKALLPLIKEEGRVIVSSCNATEFSLVLPGDANSLFTKHLLRGLGGEAAVGGLVTFGRLIDHVALKVASDARAAGETQTVIYDARKASLLVLARAPAGDAKSPAKGLAIPALSKLRHRIEEGFSSWGDFALFVADLSGVIDATGYIEAGRPLLLTMGTLGGQDTRLPNMAQNLIERLKSRGLLEYLVVALDEWRPNLIGA